MPNETERLELVDIRNVSVDRSLPREKRIAEYLRQIKDPRHYLCGEFIVTADFATNGATIEDCLRGLCS